MTPLRRPEAGAATMSVVVAVAVVVMFIVAVAAGLLGVRGAPKPNATAATAVPPASPTTLVRPEATVPANEARSVHPVLRLHVSGSGFPSTPASVTGVRDGTVVVIDSDGFRPNSTGTAHQCQPQLGASSTCVNPFPVRFDDIGHGVAQYQLAGSVGAPCTPAHGCLLRVEGDDGEIVEGSLVFGPAPTTVPHVTVAQRTGVAVGDELTVAVTQAVPGAALVIVQCVKGRDAAGSCAPVAGTPVMIANVEGEAHAASPVSGTAGAGFHCAPRSRCGLGVTAGGTLIAPVVEIKVAAEAGASYDPRRLAAGLIGALVLLGLAVWMIRVTDWSPPSEAATPEFATIAGAEQ